MKTRTDLLNHLAAKYNLKRYLEIGVQNPEQNFNKIQCAVKYSVDPDPSANAKFQITSDEFFHQNNIDVTCVGDYNAGDYPKYLPKELFDLIFIDGLHTAEQVKRDFENALKILSLNGFIVLHDCNPEKEEHTLVPRPTKTGHWNGSCYKFAASLLHKGKRTVDIDNGCMVVPNGNYQVLYEPLSIWSWDLFSENRARALNLITWDEFIKL